MDSAGFDRQAGEWAFEVRGAARLRGPIGIFQGAPVGPSDSTQRGRRLSCGDRPRRCRGTSSQPPPTSVQCNAVEPGPRLLKSALTAIFVLLLASQDRHAAAQAPVFRTAVDLVNLGVTVIDKKGQLVEDLKADDFEIYEDGRPQTVRYFVGGDISGQPAPEMHLGILLDVSESMGDDVRFTRTAAIKFLNTLLDAVDVTVVDFDTEVRAARYSQSEFPRLIERIRQQRTDGMTALYDAIGVYLDGASRQPGRKIMVLYTDGWDTRSSMRLTELLDLLKASDVTVYVIGAPTHRSPAGRDQARLVLHSIADATGGQAFFPASAKELDPMYEKVVAEIRAQYTIGYSSSNERADGAWRRIEIRLAPKDRKDLRIRARKGYYGPYKGPAKP
jgi:Ca-activated chloride channel family protein